MRLRNPRYTGTNRCWPCTALNVTLLGAGTAALYAVGGVVPAAAVLALGGSVIALHGYLIPGTPRLTRSLPAPVLAAFGKRAVGAERAVGPDRALGSVSETDALPPDPAATEELRAATATEELRAVGILDADGRVSADTEDRIHATAGEYVEDDDALERAITETFHRVVEVSARRSLGGGENWFAFDDGEVTVRQWEARAVAAVDTAGTELLAERVPDWSDRSADDRAELAALVRYGLRACPACGEAYVEPDGPRVTCCGGRSLVGERRCPTCEYALVDRNDLPTDSETTDPETTDSEATDSGVSA